MRSNYTHEPQAACLCIVALVLSFEKIADFKRKLQKEQK